MKDNWLSVAGHQFPNVLFLALDTYSRTGGLQRFNRRVISGLAGLASTAGTTAPVVHLMRDNQEQVPKLAASIVGFGPDRVGFIRRSLAAASSADLLILGQINLLPVGWLAKRLNPRLRLMLFVHGIEVWNDAVYRRKRFYEPFLLRSVDRIASVSTYTADLMARHFAVPSQIFRLFPNAVDGPVSLAPEPRTARVLLAVTRMAAHDRGKNLDVVLRAFAQLPDTLGDAILEIVGDGEVRPEFEALAQSLGLAQRVRFLGRVNDDELAACYGRASAFVLPSSKEGFGIVYLEAWKHGVPVICGTEGASHEIVSDGLDGLVVNPADVEALARAMAQLLLDPQAAAHLGARGAEKVATHYLDANFRRNLQMLVSELA